MSAAPASGLHSQGRCLTSIISILEREHEGGFGHSSPSRNTATVPPDALCGRGRARGEVATPNSLQLHHDCAFRDSWSGHTSFAGILGDPLSCCPSALVGTSLVLVDRDREPSASGAHEGIAHETLDPPDETFHFSFVLLQEVEKRLRPFARIVSHHSMHDTLSYSRCSSRKRRSTRTIADLCVLLTAHLPRSPRQKQRRNRSHAVPEPKEKEPRREKRGSKVGFGENTGQDFMPRMGIATRLRTVSL